MLKKLLATFKSLKHINTIVQKRFNKNYVPIHIGGIYVIGIYKITNLINGKAYIGQLIKEEKIKIAQEKKVKQIDPNTNQVLNIFPSENDAARFLGKKKGNHIGEACRGIHKIVYGFVWEYA